MLTSCVASTTLGSARTLKGAPAASSGALISAASAVVALLATEPSTQTVSAAQFVYPPRSGEASGGSCSARAAHSLYRTCGPKEIAKPGPTTRGRLDLSLESPIYELAKLLESNPRVKAVSASRDDLGVHVWTYLDSVSRRDRTAVYGAEAEILSKYAHIPLDFHTILVGGKAGRFETEGTIYLFRH